MITGAGEYQPTGISKIGVIREILLRYVTGVLFNLLESTINIR